MVNRGKASNRKPPFIVAIALVAAWLALAGGAAIATDGDLDPFRWKNRLLFLFAPESSHPLFESLKREIAARRQDMDDRDLIVFEILGVGSSSAAGSQLDPPGAASFRKRFDVSPNAFTVILVGKDGGVKLKTSDAVPLEDVFRLIDSMPMRRDEMRQKDQQP